MTNILLALWEKTKYNRPLIIGELDKLADLSNVLRNKVLENPNDISLLIEHSSFLVSRHLYYDEACYYLDRVIKLNPQNWEAYFWKALILFFEYKDYNNTDDVLNKALILNPERACLLQLKGFNLLELENKPSDKYFKKTVCLEPDWLLSRLQLIYFLIQNQALDAAIKEINIIKSLINHIRNNPLITSSLKESYYETYITGRTSLNQIEEFINENCAQLAQFVNSQ